MNDLYAANSTATVYCCCCVFRLQLIYSLWWQCHQFCVCIYKHIYLLHSYQFQYCVNSQLAMTERTYNQSIAVSVKWVTVTYAPILWFKFAFFFVASSNWIQILNLVQFTFILLFNSKKIIEKKTRKFLGKLLKKIGKKMHTIIENRDTNWAKDWERQREAVQ